MKKLLPIIISSIISINTANAFEITNTVREPIHAHNALKVKKVILEQIKLTPAEEKALYNFNPKVPSPNKIHLDLPTSIDLGMNGVPVLDQGNHGTCVTFAHIGVIDAIYGKGDYLSPLCSLELGSYLEKRSYVPSGWDGTYVTQVINQLLRFGAITKRDQLLKSCAGIKEYPVEIGEAHGNSMTAEEYMSMSKNLLDAFYPVTILNTAERLDPNIYNADLAEKTLNTVKDTLAKGNRVTFGVFLIRHPYCGGGACAKYKTEEDTWALTKEVETPPFNTGGHTMIVIGYDDNAVATDREGKQYKGLLKLRNSWGDDVGDHGDFYMSYDYFKKLAHQVQKIIKI